MWGIEVHTLRNEKKYELCLLQTVIIRYYVVLQCNWKRQHCRFWLDYVSPAKYIMFSRIRLLINTYLPANMTWSHFPMSITIIIGCPFLPSLFHLYHFWKLGDIWPYIEPWKYSQSQRNHTIQTCTLAFNQSMH